MEGQQTEKASLFHFLSVSLLILVCSISLAWSWSDCGSDGISLTSVSMEDCPNSSNICWAKKNQNESLYVVFTPLLNYTNLTITVNASMGFNKMKFPLLNGGLICSSGAPCPMVAGATEKARLSFLLNDSLPIDFNVKTRWWFHDENGTIRGCFQVTFMILKYH